MLRIAYNLRRGKDDNGVSYIVDDPGLTENDQIRIRSAGPLDFLELSCISGIKFGVAKYFVELYLKYCHDIETTGILATLEELIRN